MSSVAIKANFVPDSVVREQVVASPGWHVMGLKMLARSVQLAPGEMGSSMFLRFVYGPDGRLEIGSKRTVKGNIALLDLIVEGTKRHFIPMGAPGSPSGGPLAFEWAKGGGSVVFAWVNHPGTKKNPFVQRAMQQIIHEGAGLNLVPV